MELTEQNIELKRKWEQFSEQNRQPRSFDQPAFASSPAYKSLMASLGVSANSGQVHRWRACVTLVTNCYRRCLID